MYYGTIIILDFFQKRYNFRNFLINDFKKDIESLKKLIKRDHISLPNKFKKFNQLIKNENKSRFDCIMLPFNAILKAINL